MKYWYDCEFIEDGRTIDLVSIGIVAEDGRELYLQSCEFNIDKANQWVRDNVLMHLDLCPHITQPTSLPYSLGTVIGAQAQHKKGQCTFEQPAKAITGLRGVKISGGFLIGTHADCPWRTRKQMEQELLSFMNIEKHGTPELWGYYSAYDHVAFCQLFGPMIDLPRGFPMYTRDIKQWCDALGNPKLPEQGKGEHHALADAKHNHIMYEFLERYEEEESHQWTQEQIDDLKRRWNALTEGKDVQPTVITVASALALLRKWGYVKDLQ